MTAREVEFEVVPTPDPGKKSMFADDATPTLATIDSYRLSKGKAAEIVKKLCNLGVTVRKIGEFSISAACSESTFESLFSTKISEQKLKGPKDLRELEIRAPIKGAPWKIPTTASLDTLIERAYIQHRPDFFADERPLPPFYNDKFRLRVPGDVAQFVRASEVHRRGFTGRGVKVAMPDTGFYRHPYFIAQGYNFLAVTAPDTVDHLSDAHGHGTGECANLLAVAPGINFIGVKMNNPTLAITTAVELNPDIITNSWGYSLDVPGTGMPNWLRPLYLTILDAVARGITVCFSAGNGHFGFPGSMPEVISVGGVYVDENLRYQATPYASGFDSTWFPGRRTPDVCGLVGIPPTADYIVLPVQMGAALQRDPGSRGWGTFSGTSAASPMVAGVCALLKEANPKLTPLEIKNILRYTARDITAGTNAHGKAATPGPDGATGFGLVDADRAIDVLV